MGFFCYVQLGFVRTFVQFHYAIKHKALPSGNCGKM